MPPPRRERFETNDLAAPSQPDSLTSLIYILKLTFLRLFLHTLAVTCLTTRLWVLPFIYICKKIASRAKSIAVVFRGLIFSPLDTFRSLYRLYCILYSQASALPLEVEEGGAPEVHFDSDSLGLEHLETSDYHRTLKEVARGSISTAQRLADDVFDNTREVARHDPHADLVPAMPKCFDPILDKSSVKSDSCPECTDEYRECSACSQGRRMSRLSRLLRRARSDGSFERPAGDIETWRPTAAPVKKSGKLQKKRSKF